MPPSQVWPRRQEVQWVSAVLAPIEEVERTDTVVARNSLQEQGEREERIRRNPYAININRGRNCYNYGRFGHFARNCRNWEIVGQGRRIEYDDNLNIVNNLREEENLVVLN